MATTVASSPMSQPLMLVKRFTALPLCAAAGLVGGLVLMTVTLAGLLTGPVLGTMYGAMFALLFSKRTSGPGSGLLWGLGFALLLWLAAVTGPLVIAANVAPDALDTNRDSFPELVGYVLCFGAPFGLLLGFYNARQTHSKAQPFSYGRALLGGGVAGIVGGWAFGKWMEQVDFFPLIAGLAGSHSHMLGQSLHFLFAVMIGITFALLFQREVRGLGSSMACGAAYGIFWWFLGPLTLMPLWLGRPLNWSIENASSLFGSLAGHYVYGLVAGLLYGCFDRLWLRFSTEADPIRREPEGPGVRLLHSAKWGAMAGLAGGLLYALVLLATRSWVQIAAVAGGTSPALGLLIHLLTSILVGIT